MKKGLLILFTGDGKGKTTAALGMALRAAGHQMRVLILQFIKGTWVYGELMAVGHLPQVSIETLGSGFTWNKDDPEEDRNLAAAGWQRVMEALTGGNYDMIILDELNIVLHYGLLPLEQVIDDLRRRPDNLHLVITGRGAPPELVEEADLVTEMVPLKHPYREQGISAQKGVEF